MTTLSVEKPKRKIHPNSLANIQPPPHKWKPGETGNPAGLSITARARMAIDKGDVCPYDAKGRPWGEALKDSLLRQALTRVDGMRTLLYRLEGPVTETPAVIVDNRQYNFLVTGDDAKAKMQQLLSGKPKELDINVNTGR
jgi:hypothetical protein